MSGNVVVGSPVTPHVAGMRGSIPLCRWEEDFMARSGVRPVVTLRSSLGTGIACVTWKNRQSDRVQLVLRKYGPVAGELVPFREER